MESKYKVAQNGNIQMMYLKNCYQEQYMSKWYLFNRF